MMVVYWLEGNYFSEFGRTLKVYFRIIINELELLSQVQFEVLDRYLLEFTAELLFVLAVVVSVLRSLHVYLVEAIDSLLIAAYK